jgi:hypothetical protein
MTPEARMISPHFVNKLVASRKTSQSMGSPTICGTYKNSFLLFKSLKNINTQFLADALWICIQYWMGFFLYCYDLQQ